MEVCVMGRVRTCRLYSVYSVGSECGGLWGLDRCGCFRWCVD